MGATLFYFRKRIFGNVLLNKTSPEATELSIMETPLNMEAGGNDIPGARGATIFCPDIPEADASNSRPLSAPLTVDLFAASGMKLNEWNTCRSCQVSIYI
jgi:hypothetical protein